MGLLDSRKEKKEEKKQLKAEARATKEQSDLTKMLEKYGLNLDDYTYGDLRNRNAQDIQKIASSLAGNKLLQAGMTLSFAKSEEQAKVSYLGALVDQNWILIRQNEAILRALAKLSSNR